MDDGGDADLPEGDASLASTNPISCDNYTSTVKSLKFRYTFVIFGKIMFL